MVVTRILRLGSFVRRRNMYLAVREVFESHSIVALNSADMFFLLLKILVLSCDIIYLFAFLCHFEVYAKIKEKQSTLCLPA